MQSSPEQGPPPLDEIASLCPAAGILEEAPAEGLVVEPYRPLCRSLDWELGQLFYQRRGNRVFLNGEVPYLVNNDGLLAARAAALFFASLEERERSGLLERDVWALEFGAGSCLFARGLLQTFCRISKERGRDYHERLTYVVADHSEHMLKDAERYQVLPAECKVLFARADAIEQTFSWPSSVVEPPHKFHAIFLNYLLDCLPAAVVRRAGGDLEQLWVQTELSTRAMQGAKADEGKNRVLAFARGEKPDRDELIDYYPLFQLRRRYQSPHEADLAHLESIGPFVRDQKPVMHSYGAVACLEACMGKLHGNGGLVLFSDYRAAGRGPSDATEDARQYSHQHFGSSTAIGLNYEQLKDVICGVHGASWVEPETDDDSLMVRLAGLDITPATAARFRSLFDRNELLRVRVPREQARNCSKEGAHQLAREHYREAIRLQPENWHLLAETAAFCENALGQHETALSLGRAGLELNPIDPDLWNTVGDALYSLARYEEAHRAFLWVLQLSPANVRARHNLVYTLTRAGNLEEALAMVAEALAADHAGEFTERLLQRQKEVLNALKQRRRRTSERMADRYVSG